MIFDCPRCDAENAVPASDIPPEGKVVHCISCKQPFRVLPPEDDDEDSQAEGYDGDEDTTHLKAPESADPAENPFPPDEDTMGFPVTQLSPAPSTTPAAARPRDTHAISTSPALPAGQDISAVRNATTAPQSSVTLPVGQRTVPMATNPAISVHATIPPNVPVAIPPARGPSPIAPALPPDQQKGLGRRGRPRAGNTGGELPQPEEDRTPPAGTAAPRIEPAVVVGPTVEVSNNPGLPGALAKMPLAVRVGVIVFVLTLIAVVAVRTISRAGVAPIAVEIAPNPSPRVVDAPRVSSEPHTSTIASPDVPLDGAHAYVVADEVRLRSQAGDAGELVGRVRAGAQVRVLEAVAGYTLIWIGDRGPVGFVPTSALGGRMPLAALAEAMAYPECHSIERPCAELGALGERRCRLACDGPTALLPGEDKAALVARCEEACSLARSRCEHDCETGRGRSPKK
ncbi:MAG: MJ0042-type zinc finger domain-containing protein [Myxococcota bacterium]